MYRILIVEDEQAINSMIRMNLTAVGYETASAYDGREALALIEGGAHFDLALLDVMLPGMDGTALLGPLQERDIPAIFLTARGDLETKLKGLLGGAEDYMVKPFEMPELLVRMDKVLRRRAPEEATVWRAGDVTLDAREHTAWKAGRPLLLTPLEFDLLLLLVRNKNMAFSREKLLDEVWGIRYEGGTRTVDVHVAQLRRKTGLNIAAVPKVGYRLEERQ